MKERLPIKAVLLKQNENEVHDLDVDAIKVFVSRKRDQAKFEEMKESIRTEGLKIPIQVRDISGRPAEERKKPGGGFYKWELVFGQGRLRAHQELGLRKISGTITAAPEAEIVGRFLAENMIRKPLPWAVKAKIVKAEIDAGKSADEVAKLFFITPSHVVKLLRVVNKTAAGLEEDVSAMPMNDAEAFITLPVSEQAIVVEALREDPTRQVRDVMRKAVEIKESGKELSPMAVRHSLKRVDDDLAAIRKSMKTTRLHHALGPGNIVTLLGNRKFRAAIEKAGVNVRRFMEVSE